MHFASLYSPPANIFKNICFGVILSRIQTGWCTYKWIFPTSLTKRIQMEDTRFTVKRTERNTLLLTSLRKRHLYSKTTKSNEIFFSAILRIIPNQRYDYTRLAICYAVKLCMRFLVGSGHFLKRNCLFAIHYILTYSLNYFFHMIFL